MVPNAWSMGGKMEGLPKLDGGMWHPYRLAWATAKKHHPIKDLAAAGGGRDTETLLQCYQQPDKDTLLEVTSEVRCAEHVGGAEKQPPKPPPGTFSWIS